MTGGLAVARNSARLSLALALVVNSGSAFGAGAFAAIGRLAGSPKRFDEGALAVDFDDEASKEEK